MRHELMLIYIPRDRCDSLANGVDLPSKANGAVLFADVSGFTSLTESLTRTFGARRGAEELTRQLNRVYDALCDEVDRYHGAILGFSGDAITCWFNSDAAPEDGALLAMTCAFALQDAMQAFKQVALPNGDTIAFSIKVVVASGSAFRYVIGDPDVQVIDVVVGDMINRIAQAEHLAHKGEIVVDTATIELLAKTGQTIGVVDWRVDAETGDRFAAVEHFDPRRAALPWSAFAPENVQPEQARQWLMKSLYERDDEMLTELRQAAALFVSFQGIDYEHDPEAYDKLNGFVRWAQSVLVSNGGTLIQVTTGEKGGFLYIAFGAPVAYDNIAELAAQTALQLIALPPELRYVKSVQIGLSQGIMRTGAYGGKTRRTYGVLGDDTNLAARLMQAAQPGEILVSPRIAKALAGKFEFAAREPIRVKGKQEPIAVSRLMRHAEISQTSQFAVRRLVGRSRELADLIAHLTPSADPQGGCVYVWGEPGIGKSHLINAAKVQIDSKRQVVWYHGKGEQIVRQSLHVVMPFLYNFFNQESGETSAHKKAQFEGVIDGLIDQLAARDDTLHQQVSAALDEARWSLGALLGLRWRGSPYENLDPKLRFGRSLEAIATLLCAYSLVHPVIVHLQDSQWLDEDSKLLLALLAERAAHFPFFLLLDSRIPYADFGVDLSSSGATPLHVMDVNRLAPESVRELAEDVLGGAISDALHSFLLERAGGNPFFTEQLALDLFERRLLVWQDDARWGMSDATADEMPGTINAVLVARLDRLVSEVRSIVQIASVIGHEFAVPVLASMTNDEAGVRRRVKQAETETIWSGLDEIIYQFRHVLLRDAAYSMQLQERLRELHLLAAKAIERIYAADLSSKYPDLAYHYESAGQNEPAVTYLVKAAQQMMNVYANRDALGYLQRAAELVQHAACSPTELATIYEGLGDLYDMFGEYQQSVAHYDLGLAHLNADYAALRTKLLRKRGEILQKWGRYDDASASYENALVELQADLNADEACRIYAGLSMINYRQDQVDDAVELAMLALLMAEGDEENTAQALQNLGILFWKKRDWQQALDYDTQSLALWQGLNRLNGSAAVHNNLGLLYFDMGNVETAVTHYELGLQAFEKVGNLHGLACIYDNLGRAYMEKGDQEQAVKCLEQAVTILAKIGLSETEVFSSMWVAGTW